MKKKKIFIIAGEESGDIIAAHLIRSLKNYKIEFYGVGGHNMEEAGAKLVSSYKTIAIMGFLEVLCKYFRLSKFFKKILQSIIKYNPDLIITIDSPGFNFRIIKALKGSFKAIHYVAPTVWAYKEHRAQLVADLYQHILLILPFEQRYFKHMPNTFVGHPIIEDPTCLLTTQKFNQVIALDEFKINSKQWIISIMPGSRESELKQHLPLLREVIRTLNQFYGQKIIFKFLMLPYLKTFFDEELSHYIDLQNIILVEYDITKHNQAIQESIIGLVKCGTATMRFMANGTPAITFFKTSKITAWIIKKGLKISHFNLCNIIMNSDVMPEFIQDNFTKQNILFAVQNLLNSTEKRQRIIKFYFDTWAQLQQQDKPSAIAAKVILEHLNNIHENN